MFSNSARSPSPPSPCLRLRQISPLLSSSSLICLPCLLLAHVISPQGVGLTSIVLALESGARCVLATDYDQPVLDNLLHNFHLNGVHASTEFPLDATGTKECEAVVRQLDWRASPYVLSAAIQRFKPDVVLACDTVYLPELHTPLARLFQVHSFFFVVFFLRFPLLFLASFSFSS